MAEVVSGDHLQQTLAYAAEKLCLDRLNEIQEEAIAAFIDDKDVFVNLPTGYGKSAVFQSVHFVLDYIGGGTNKSTYCLDRRAYSCSYARPGTCLESEGDLS